MPDLTKLEQYIALADRLVALADKTELAECARLLAINVAHYENKYGELPLEERLSMVQTNDLNEQQCQLVVKGMETMVGVLGGVIQGLDDKISH